MPAHAAQGGQAGVCPGIGTLFGPAGAHNGPYRACGGALTGITWLAYTQFQALRRRLRAVAESPPVRVFLTMSAGYVHVLVAAMVGVLFGLATFLVSAIFRPYHPDETKRRTYECGEPPVGQSWVMFDVHFYVVALLFVLFDVEAIFLIPWAMALGKVGWLAFLEGAAFIMILAIGLAYAWRKRALEWVR